MNQVSEKEFRKNFAKEVIALRLWSGLEQEEFADELNISRATMSHLESGRTGFNEEILVGLFNHCNYYVVYMLVRAAFPDKLEAFLAKRWPSVVRKLIDKELKELRKLGPAGDERFYLNEKTRMTAHYKQMRKKELAKFKRK